MRKLFRFKQFSVKDSNCAMKVGTDAVLLGSWVKIENAACILDIGTGSGIIAMMMAQRSNGLIEAVELDKGSFENAKFNFENCLWRERLKVYHLPFSAFAATAQTKYDLVVCNPPYYNNCLKSPSEKVNVSRHTTLLTHNELIAGSKELLISTGKLTVILPTSEFQAFLELATMHQLYCSKKCLIFPKPDKPYHRVLAEFGLQRPVNIESSEITIRDGNEKYHPDYINLTKDFYIHF
jgi:tRNA1Val (adenine37-N6)-methyltransferase